MPWSRGLQQKEHPEWEKNLCPSESTGPQDWHTTCRSSRLTSSDQIWNLVSSALSSIIIDHNGLPFFEEWDEILHISSVYYVCTDTGPPDLSYIREKSVVYSKYITQWKYSRKSTRNGNLTSASMQALGYTWCKILSNFRPSLMCWFTVIHHYRLTYSDQIRSRMVPTRSNLHR